MNYQHSIRAVLVIGNGFDLDLRLKTRYSDFTKSDEWRNMVEQNIPKSNCYSLLKYLNDRRKIDNWFDIEQALVDYASTKTKGIWLHDVGRDKEEFFVICKTLGDYLTNHLLHSSHDISNLCGSIFLQRFQFNSENKRI